MKKFNINCSVYVKLTEKGKELWIEYDNSWKVTHPDLNLELLTLEKIDKRANKFGYHSFQMYDFMKIFGHTFRVGMSMIIVGNNMYFDEDDIPTSDDIAWERDIKLTNLID